MATSRRSRLRSTGLECCGTRRRLSSVGLAYTPAALLAILMPKCPLCFGALLALVGVTRAVPSYSYALVVLASVALGTLVVVRWCVVARRTGEARPPAITG